MSFQLGDSPKISNPPTILLLSLLAPLSMFTYGCGLSGEEKEMFDATIPAHQRGLISVTFAPDFTTFVTNGADHTISSWSFRERRQLWRVSAEAGKLAYSPDGKLIAGGVTDMSDEWRPTSVAKLWDPATGKEIATLKNDDLAAPAGSVAFSPDGRTLALISGSDFTTKRSKITLWDVKTLKVQGTLEGGDGMTSVHCMAFSSDGKKLAVGGIGADEPAPLIVIWTLSPKRGAQRFAQPNSSLRSIAFSPDGTILAVGGGSAEGQSSTLLQFFDAETAKELATLHGVDHPVQVVCFLPDGKLLLSGGGDQYAHIGELKLWDVRSRKLIERFSGHTDMVTDVSISSDGKWVLSGSRDHSVKIWNIHAILESAEEIRKSGKEKPKP
jgi:WD40 repeat protein